jgi:hypothetical protein
MLTVRSMLPLVLVACAIAPAAAESASGPVTDKPLEAAFNATWVSAYDGVLAWSRLDPETGRFRLVYRQKGKVVVPKISNRPQPFDATVGPDEKNRPVITYSRCTAEDEQSGCDAYRYDIARQRETKLASLSLEGQDEKWPVQWKKNFAVARVKYNGDASSEANRCDKVYTRPTKQELGIKTVDLQFGVCGIVGGLAFRGSTVLYTVLSQSGGTNRSEVRVVPIDPKKKSRRLASRSYTKPSDVYAAPVLDGTYAYVSRTGTGPTARFVRLRLKDGKAKEVEAQQVLAGPVARDTKNKGRTTYVEVQGAIPGDPCAPVTPCRIVDAGADPFTSTARIIPPKLVLNPPAEDLFGNQPLPVAGSMTQDTVQNGKVTATRTVAGVPIRILRASYAPNPAGQSLVPTQATGVTGGDGIWRFTVPPPVPVFGFYAAVTTNPGIAAQSRVVVLKTKAVVTLTASATTVARGGTVTFTGTVDPVQKGRTVNLLLEFAPGQTEAITQVPLNDDGSFQATAKVTSAGSFIAELPEDPNDGSQGNATYTGRSAPVAIAVTG